MSAKSSHADEVLYCHSIEDATFQALHQKSPRLSKYGILSQWYHAVWDTSTVSYSLSTRIGGMDQDHTRPKHLFRAGRYAPATINSR